MYDLIIIGGGPAGTAAGVYAARKRLKTLLITEDFGGQSFDSLDIQNWIGTTSISGMDLGKSFEEHLHGYLDDCLEIKKGSRALEVSKNDDGSFTVITKDEEYKTKTVLVATGSTRKKLQVPGAEEFEHKGITYCASCDAPMFGGQDVVVIGGGNAGFETASQLLEHAKSVTLLQHSAVFKADPITVEKVLERESLTALKNAETKEVKGDKFVSSLVYTDTESGEDQELAVTGVFVEIGLLPSTSFVKDLVDLTELGQIKIDPATQRTSVEGVWAAGDSSNVLYHQNNIAAGDGVRALEDIYLYLRTGK